ncbi:MAG: hypothetical protein COA73_07685 [Candidatus Hydrogenedentota bacterium]|nr:MAG: hypothetical protein COA73_07685 [Candidatus Hydrogenedentota bacterium]
MPCNDVTEILAVDLDGEERLVDYRFAKLTCGQPVGDVSLLAGVLKGRTVDDLLKVTAESFLAEFPAEDELGEFLSLKHFFAVQSALEVYVGLESGAKDSLFAAAEVEYGPDSVRIQGRLAVELMEEKIEACSNCKACNVDDFAKQKAKQRMMKRTIRKSFAPSE